MLKNFSCKICNIDFENGKKLSNHLKKIHKISSLEYTIQYLYNGLRPTCLSCERYTRYISFKFKQYCQIHSKEAMKIGGSKGGKNKIPWAKGKTKENDDRLKNISISFQGKGNPFYGKKHNDEIKKLLKENNLLSEEEYNERLLARRNDFKVLTKYEEYFSRQKTYLILQCQTCGQIQKKTLQSFERGSLCQNCYPFTISKDEVEIANYIQELGFIVERNNRELLSPYEIDIYVPEKSFAIEYNGLFWHSFNFEKNKNKHWIKTKKALQKNITLLHIFSDEWNNKKELIKSMIAHKLGVSKIRLPARKLIAKEIKENDAKLFFNNNHIDGYTRSLINFGLILSNDNDKQSIVACLSLRKPLHAKTYSNALEIARFAIVKNHSIPGSFSKLLNYAINWIRNNAHYCNNIITYADLRFGTGHVYAKNGFEIVKENTGISFWYTDGKQKYNRFKFRAKNNLSEKEVAIKAGVYRIYGCGNALYRLNI